MPQQPTLFADGVMEANVTFGVARITLAQTGGDGKPAACGQLIVPLVQLPAFANGLMTLLKQIDAKVKQAQAAAAQAPAIEVAAPPAEQPSAPASGAFRFGS